MLHKNVIEQKSGFRPLDEVELTAVGGGYYDENPIGDDGTGGFGSQAEYFSATGIWIDDPVVAEVLVGGLSSGGFGAEGGAPQAPIIGSDGNGNFLILFGSSATADNGSGGVTTAPDHEPAMCGFVNGMESFGQGTVMVGTIVGGVALIEPTPGGEVVAGAILVVGGVTTVTAWGFQWVLGCDS